MNNASNTLPPRCVTIIGGGFSGASAAVQLVRTSPVPLAITIVEPRPEVGGGLAHSADDPDHRLNGTTFQHFVDPEDPESFSRWCTERGLLHQDPGAVAPGGSLFMRRKDFGAFVADTVRAHAAWPTGSTIHHLQDVVTDASAAGGTMEVRTQGGRVLSSDMLIVATGNALPRLPAEFDARVSASAAVVTLPSDLERVRAIPKSARVLVLGTGLTALDILSTLLRSGHEGVITAVSRRGLRPSPQRPPSPTQRKISVSELLARVEGPVAPFILAAGNPPTLRRLLRALRERIREIEATGDLWYTPYDELRDVFWQVWPTLPLREKIRFVKRLRPWWEAYRFRSPPQNEALVRAAEARGRVVFQTTRIRSVAQEPDGCIRVVLQDRGGPSERVASFDAVINCTGLDAAAGARDNPVLAALLRQGLVSVDATGVGLAVDAGCRAIGADGRVHDGLRIIGPPTNGAFGDQVGAPFIAMRIRRALPSMHETLGTP
ncbi:FAD/NAD(P)-binding protein [Hydrogenophaga sp. PBL-H3]|uniref:FAD/NAD(P)-binding protein n=1 Tax=Hydrogenophaga sp. PBL-H3 TaxID=434010 RepID=UPI0013588C50|nr:FAD/NAD(P)-binding protein [Hydrogenophaga sp. PBL-H3]